jgi:SAM-dependent methyltransferase
LNRTPVRNDLRRQSCPACGAARIALMGEVPTQPATEYSTHAIALQCRPEIWRCRACKSWFTQNAVPQEVSRELYATGTSGERWTAERFEAAKGPELVAEFDRHVGDGTRLLDVGCSTGQLLDYAKARGAQTWGVDFSAACREVNERKGHRFATALDEVAAERFDVVSAFDVIEHSYDLAGFLAALAGVLKPNGMLLVLTGDVGSPSARICRNRWWYVRYPEHIVFPSRRYLCTQPAGLRLERVVRTFASVGYRVPYLNAVRAAGSLWLRRAYEGLPAIGPDHMLAVLRRG